MIRFQPSFPSTLLFATTVMLIVQTDLTVSMRGGPRGATHSALRFRKDWLLRQWVIVSDVYSTSIFCNSVCVCVFDHHSRSGASEPH